MTHRVILQPRAEREIWAAAQWIEEQTKSAVKARRWACGLRAKIATLKTHPKRCPVDADSAAYGEEVRVLLSGRRQGEVPHPVHSAWRGGPCADGAACSSTHLERRDGAG
jgi:plasmid stabilization system protein ParE